MFKVFNRGFGVWFFVSIFYAFQYIIRVLPNVISPMIISKFNITASSLGQFSGLYYVGYTIAHIPIGVLLDKYGPRGVIFFSIILTVIGMLPLLYSDVWLYCQIGRVVVGVGSAAAALGIFKVSYIYYHDKFSIMVGMSIIIGLLGAIYGGLPILYFIQKMGWNFVFSLYIILGVILAIMFFICAPSDYHCNTKEEGIWNNIKHVIFNRDVILISLFAGFMVGPLEGFADGWATSFLSEGYGISYSTASVLPSVMFLGTCFGSFILPLLATTNAVKNFNLILLSASIMFFAFLLLLTCYISITIIIISLFIIGFGCAYQVILSCNIVLYVNEDKVALASAISNMIVMLFGYFFHTAISSIIELSNLYQVTSDGVVYGKTLLIKALSVIPIGLIIGFFGCLWLRARANKN